MTAQQDGGLIVMHEGDRFRHAIIVPLSVTEGFPVEYCETIIPRGTEKRCACGQYLLMGKRNETFPEAGTSRSKSSQVLRKIPLPTDHELPQSTMAVIIA